MRTRICIIFIFTCIAKLHSQQAGMRPIYGGGYVFDAEKYKVDMAAKQYSGSSSSSGFGTSSGSSNIYRYRPSREERKQLKLQAQQAEYARQAKIHQLRIDSAHKDARKWTDTYSKFIENYMRIHAYTDFLRAEAELYQHLDRNELLIYRLSGKLPKLEREYRTLLSSFHMLALVETEKYQEAFKYYKDHFLARNNYREVNAKWYETKNPIPIDESYHIRFKNDGKYFEDSLLYETDFYIADLALIQAMDLQGLHPDFLDEVIAFYSARITPDAWLDELLAFTHYFHGRTEKAVTILNKIIGTEPEAQTRILLKISNHLLSQNINPLNDQVFNVILKASEEKYYTEIVQELKVKEMKKTKDYHGLLQHYTAKHQALNIPDSVFYTNHAEYLDLWEAEVRYYLLTGNKTKAVDILKKAYNFTWHAETVRINKAEKSALLHAQKMAEYGPKYNTKEQQKSREKYNNQQMHSQKLARLQCAIDIILPPVLFEENEWELIKTLAEPHKNDFSAYARTELASINYVRPPHSSTIDRFALLEEKCNFRFNFSRRKKEF